VTSSGVSSLPSRAWNPGPRRFVLSNPPVRVEEVGEGLQVRSQALPEHLGDGVRPARYDLTMIENLPFGEDARLFFAGPDHEGLALCIDHDDHEGARCEPIGNLLLDFGEPVIRGDNPYG